MGGGGEGLARIVKQHNVVAPGVEPVVVPPHAVIEIPGEGVGVRAHICRKPAAKSIIHKAAQVQMVVVPATVSALEAKVA